MNRVSSIVLAAVCSMASAGPLTPPPGPVAPGGKTTAQIEPRTPIGIDTTPGDADSVYRIDRPGSYYLTENLFGEDGKSCIEVASDGVQIDLMGFELFGGFGSTLDGIAVSGSRRGLTILNGRIRSFGRSAIAANTIDTAVYRDLLIQDSGFVGLWMGDNAVADRVSARNNFADGILAGTGCTIVNCSTFDNNGEGIQTGVGCVIENCTAANNGNIGISLASNGTIRGSNAYNNGSIGISVNINSRAIGCTSTSNGSDGFSLNFNAQIIDCSANSNIENGIEGNDSALIEGCSAIDNRMNGIRVRNASTVRDNKCEGNGVGTNDGAGVFVTGVENRIDGNDVANNDRGIDVDGTRNLVIRNSASSNGSNYTIVGNNSVGLLITLNPSGIISGTTGGSGVGGNQAWANINY
ncbi:MAG: right-handed parallel beta-helix repeat-containing protein [Planctomycetota bacterium]